MSIFSHCLPYIMYIINVSSENIIFNQTKYNVDNYLPSHNLSVGRYMNIVRRNYSLITPMIPWMIPLTLVGGKRWCLIAAISKFLDYNLEKESLYCTCKDLETLLVSCFWPLCQIPIWKGPPELCWHDILKFCLVEWKDQVSTCLPSY